ncbi:glycoside hydrolase family 43 protein [Schaalia vaccimaxillae]|uniref:glycoside hydrolase family 43 protein n=1 Tax=Schaalia vaccimaxillae TaxID=183916 RepID=UPI0003B4E84D|nr:glycoside hydrolase family 43 protein [Schaalia vaccimaxillae]
MTARNPIIPGLAPDPSACQVGDTTYIVNSSFTWLPGLPIFASTDLSSWELIGHALTEDNSAILDLNLGHESQGIFAPTLRYIGGRFVLVCTTVVGTTERSFVMTADRAEGPWSQPRFLDGAGGIDPDVFEDEDGQVWWTGTRLAADPLWEQQTEIWTRPVDLDAAVFTGDETVIWHGAVEGVVWSEGPHIYRIGDWYYLLTAEGGTAEEHSVSIARSQSITGPWQGCKRNPVFTHRNLGRGSQIHNIGHADLFQRPDGSWWAVMLGVRLRDNHHLLGRETFLCPVAWEDGWPVIAPGLGRVPDAVDVRDGIDPYTRSFVDVCPDRGPSTHEIEVADLYRGSIRPVGADWAHVDRADFCGVPAAHWKCAMSVSAIDAASSNLEIGIVQDARNWLRIGVTDDGAILATVCRQGETEKFAVADTADERVWLCLDDAVVHVGVGPRDGLGQARTLDARWLSTESAGGFTGCLLGAWGPSPEITFPVRLTGARLRS